MPERGTMVEEHTCYRCGAPLDRGERRCSHCGRRQYRTCYCGAVLHKTVRTCEACGADWRAVARRRSLQRRRGIRGQDLARHAIIGALVAAALAAVLRKVLYALAALVAARQDISVPPGMGAQLWLVVVALARGIADTVLDLIGGGWQTVGLLAVMLVGAATATLLYLGKVGAIRPRRSRPRRRRRR